MIIIGTDVVTEDRADRLIDAIDSGRALREPEMLAAASYVFRDSKGEISGFRRANLYFSLCQSVPQLSIRSREMVANLALHSLKEDLIETQSAGNTSAPNSIREATEVVFLCMSSSGLKCLSHLIHARETGWFRQGRGLPSSFYKAFENAFNIVGHQVEEIFRSIQGGSIGVEQFLSTVRGVSATSEQLLNGPLLGVNPNTDESGPTMHRGRPAGHPFSQVFYGLMPRFEGPRKWNHAAVHSLFAQKVALEAFVRLAQKFESFAADATAPKGAVQELSLPKLKGTSLHTT